MRNLCSSSVCQRSYIREALLARSTLKRDGGRNTDITERPKGTSCEQSKHRLVEGVSTVGVGFSSEVLFTSSLQGNIKDPPPVIVQSTTYEVIHPAYSDFTSCTSSFRGVTKDLLSSMKAEPRRGSGAKAYSRRSGRRPESNSVGLLFPAPLALRLSLRHSLSLKY